jgi:hypothetical protein
MNFLENYVILLVEIPHTKFNKSSINLIVIPMYRFATKRTRR